MKKHLMTSLLYTAVTSLLLGIGYPLLITLAAHVMMPYQAAGEMVSRDGVVVGSRLIGQAFSGDGYFHGRPSAAGTGYDATASGGSNYAPTSKALTERVAASVRAENDGRPVPVDLVTASGSGLDPDITPAAALYQAARVARARGLSVAAVQALVRSHVTGRQLGLLGEPRVNVLELNLSLNELQKAGRGR